MFTLHTRFALGILLALAALIANSPSPAWGENFRVENKVFASGKRQPDSQGATVFQDGVVYDFLDQPAEVIVIDPAAGRFILLDMGRQVRAELSTAAVDAFCARIREAAAASTNPLVRFLAAPAFQEHFDSAAGVLTLSSPWMTYRAKLATEQSPAAAAQYAEFSDCCARLNTLLSPAARPPQARMALNAALAKLQATPREVELVIESGGKTTKARSQHECIPQLAAKDLADIASARAAMQSFKQVSFEEYRKGSGR